MLTVKPSNPYSPHLKAASIFFNAVAEDMPRDESMHALKMADFVTALARRLDRGESIATAEAAIEAALADIERTMNGDDITPATPDRVFAVDTDRGIMHITAPTLARAQTVAEGIGVQVNRERLVMDFAPVTSLDEAIMRQGNADYASSQGWTRPVVVVEGVSRG